MAKISGQNDNPSAESSISITFKLTKANEEFLQYAKLRQSKNASYEKWLKVDRIVTSWILHSISKELAKAFLYATFEKELRKEINERFGEANDSLLYQLRKEISSFTQSNISFTIYFTKFKKLGDELASLRLPFCSYGSTKTMTDFDNDDKLIQFLIGLNESYECVKDHILLMDPLPSINKAYTMFLRFEKQKDSHNISNDFNTAMAISTQRNFNEPASEKFLAKRGKINRRDDRVCTHYNTTAHMKKTYFKIYGYLEWFSKLKQEKKGKAFVATISQTL
ncbi:uncharacterized protein LOC110607721 [Manihot esculenta]|uniref:uncharacterized protein LOC110607721 n=1 Tax=Manihot esculenta TaxID=3983 RepID=UPI000B5D5EA1|nr:uncharacterized protein LOC110607721 [Manihot esculenta]